MTKEEAQEYAVNMTYAEAVYNCFNAKGVSYRKATFIKLNELAKIAHIVDKCGLDKAYQEGYKKGYARAMIDYGLED